MCNGHGLENKKTITRRAYKAEIEEMLMDMATNLLLWKTMFLLGQKNRLYQIT
jgi:hypothetical protein